mgnify:FL=1
MVEIVMAVLGSSVLTVIINRVFNILDRKKDKQDQIISEINEMKSELNKHIEDDEKHRADMSRARILRFSDELRRGISHSEESFNNILEDIDNYISYCTQHESVYINSKANAAIRNIKTTHDKCIRGEMDFL